MTFTAIDFETATGHPESACAVGIVTVEAGMIVEEYYTLIQPPNNEYWYRNIMCHGIKPVETMNGKTFDTLFPEIQKRLFGRKIVAHNEAFDRNVLTKTMRYYGLYYDELELATAGNAPAKSTVPKVISPPTSKRAATGITLSSTTTKPCPMPAPARNCTCCAKTMPTSKRTVQTPKRTMQTLKRTMQTLKRTVQTPKRTMQTPKRTVQTPKRTMQTLKRTMQTPKRTMQTLKRTMQTLKRTMQTLKRTMQTLKRTTENFLCITAPIQRNF